MASRHGNLYAAVGYGPAGLAMRIWYRRQYAGHSTNPTSHICQPILRLLYAVLIVSPTRDVRLL